MGEQMKTSLSSSNSGKNLTDQELEKHYKRCLENWREVLLHMNSLLLWNKPYYPGIIASYISFVFLILWYFEPTLLTTISILGIIACILDFAVPALSSCVFDSNKWTGTQERKFEEICQNLIWIRRKMEESCAKISQLRESKPKMYFVAVVAGLICLAWIGNVLNNLFLAYIIVLAGLLIPGIKHNGLMEDQIVRGMKMIKDLVAEKTKKN